MSKIFSNRAAYWLYPVFFLLGMGVNALENYSRWGDYNCYNVSFGLYRNGDGYCDSCAMLPNHEIWQTFGEFDSKEDAEHYTKTVREIVEHDGDSLTTDFLIYRCPCAFSNKNND